MKNINTFVLIVVWVVSFHTISCTAFGAILLQENWNSGNINTAKWVLEDTLSYSKPVEVGPGDYALRLTGNNGYDSGVRSRNPFNRGENIRCTYRMWKDSEPFLYNGVCGPWVNRDYMSGTYPTLEQIEAGIARYENNRAGVVWAEGVESWMGSLPTVETAFENAWGNATSKATSVWVRVWLGDSTGCKAEWSTDGSSWQTMKLDNGVEIDTRGLIAGSPWQGALVSSNDQIHVFFGGSYNYTFIDDIVVANDAAGYTPLPTATPTPPPEDIVTYNLIAPQGEYYEAIVPDTLDLAERAKLSVRGLTGVLNPSQDYGPFLSAYFNVNPPFMTQSYPSGNPTMGLNNWGIIAQALILARQMAGTNDNLDIELKMLKGMISFTEDRLENPIPTPNSCAILAMIDLYRQNPDEQIRSLIERWIHYHYAVSKEDEEYVWYYDEPPDLSDSHIGVLGYYYQLFINGKATRAVSTWNIIADDAQSLFFGRKLIEFQLQDRFWEAEAQPKAVVSRDRAHFMGHHHSWITALIGMLEYAGRTNDSYLKEFVRSGYEYMRNFGLARVGLFGEGCTTGDMTILAILLTEHGVGNYWEDVDCYVRNHLAELQITDEAKLRAVVNTMPANPLSLDPVTDTDDNVVQRSVGVFFSDSTHPTLIPADPNRTQDFWRDPLFWNICCSGNCTTAMHRAWDSIVRCDNNVAKVNLLLNRASPWLDIDSYLPYEGKAVIRNKTAREVYVRMPGWVARSQIKAKLNGMAATPAWFENYLVFAEVNPEDSIEITFPVVESTETYTLKWKRTDFWQESTNPGQSWEPLADPDEYTMTFRGNTLVDITPRDDRPGYPLYQREHLKETTAPKKTVMRFVVQQTERPVYEDWSPYEIAGLPQQDFNYQVEYDNGYLVRLFFEGTQGYIFKPKGAIDPQRRWVWVVPLWLPLKSAYAVDGVTSRYYVESLLANGFHVVGIDVGASLGSPAGAEIFQGFYEMVVEEYGLNQKARMFATSNGGLITYGWAFRYPQHVERIFGVYPATDFRTWPGLNKVCGPGSIAPEGLKYNLTLAEMNERISEFNPIDNLEPLAREGVKIFHLHGNQDDVVPLEENSAELMRRYHALGGEAALEILDGHAHGGMIFFESETALQFMME